NVRNHSRAAAGDAQSGAHHAKFDERDLLGRSGRCHRIVRQQRRVRRGIRRADGLRSGVPGSVTTFSECGGLPPAGTPQKWIDRTHRYIASPPLETAAASCAGESGAKAPHSRKDYCRLAGILGNQLTSTVLPCARFSESIVNPRKAMHISSVVASPHETAFGGSFGLRQLPSELS